MLAGHPGRVKYAPFGSCVILWRLCGQGLGTGERRGFPERRRVAEPAKNVARDPRDVVVVVVPGERRAPGHGTHREDGPAAEGLEENKVTTDEWRDAAALPRVALLNLLDDMLVLVVETGRGGQEQGM